ncbi:TRAP transporter small permease [Tropicimonas sp. IMCC34011]|uniref:TRAP transporter small permease n=1 Tax=Tropicimonas sp. IMCC34011 TaxID=2248759 RepID=UPI001E3BA48B|nr:TRAP transporter small permease [Tropicimonas sp. IMCC34011]
MIILGLVLMVAMTFTSTAMRVVGYGGLYWAEEVTRYISVWVVFLGSGLGVRYGVHLSVDIVLELVPHALRLPLLMFSHAAFLIFAGVLVWFGWELAISNYAQQSASLRMPMTYVHIAIPVGGALMIFETLRLAIRDIQGKPREFGGEASAD